MQEENRTVPVTFKTEGETRQIPLTRLVNSMTDFLDNCIHPSLVDQTFISLIDGGDGNSRFDRLLSAVDFKDDAYGFFKKLLSLLGDLAGTAPITLRGVTFPQQALMAILEAALPGDKFISIKLQRVVPPAKPGKR